MSELFKKGLSGCVNEIKKKLGGGSGLFSTFHPSFSECTFSRVSSGDVGKCARIEFQHLLLIIGLTAKRKQSSRIKIKELVSERRNIRFEAKLWLLCMPSSLL